MRRPVGYLLPLGAAALVGAAACIDIARVHPSDPPREITIALKRSVAPPAPAVRPAHDTGTAVGGSAEESAPADELVARKLVVPEGLTTSQVLKLVENADGLKGPITITPGEGMMLAGTYEFARGDTRDSVIARMVRGMYETAAEQWKERAPDLPLASPEEAVVLASIIVKEAGNAKESPVVGSVLVNRLRRGMKLESDVTVSYGIAREDDLPETQLKRSLTRSDLQRPTPYNTYVNDGLPPTPICNVGRETLQAALHPAKSTYLFFSASGSSGNTFARTVDEHNRNVEQMRAKMNPKPSSDVNEAMAPEGIAETPTDAR
ncbi:MAG TPA: endolytic transglycosylase MltG [Alphaproteobacteria bacterium]|nr:endolytic transglycosylase MltG [Alphaproteobacteria bacterium]